MPVSQSELVRVLERLAPPVLAEDWDNTGVLIEPPRARGVERVLLTIDLTSAVLDEAIERRADWVVAYHPPIFRPLAALRRDDPVGDRVLRCVEAGIGVYSPHTALDSAAGGVNDWLAGGIGEGRITPLSPPAPDVAERVGPGAGLGRVIELAAPAPLDEVVRRVKAHLGLSMVRVAASRGGEPGLVRSAAVCAGAGGSVLAGSAADLWLTGELRHHDVLAANARGTSVIVTDHTHTERGYLPLLAARLREELGEAVDVVHSNEDADPLVPA